MLYAGLIAIGFVLGVALTVLFGKRIAAAAVADVKAVAFDAGRVVHAAAERIDGTVNASEKSLHAHLDALKADVGNQVNAVNSGLQKSAEDIAKKL